MSDTSGPLPAVARVGRVGLTVADADEVASFYALAGGLTVQNRTDGRTNDRRRDGDVALRSGVCAVASVLPAY
jgi:catechol-2,3-dioxygenase